VRTVLLALFAGLSFGSARAGSIGLFATPDASSCALQIPPGMSGTFYVCAQSPSPNETCGGIYGAQFRIEGLPPDWQARATPVAGAGLSLGNPLEAGAAISLIAAWDGAPVLLYTVEVHPPSPGASSVLRVVAHSSPSDPNVVCPLVSGWCFDQFWFCVTGGTLYINSDTPCTVDVARSTWGNIKFLFR
jgi:hypothetical protein